MHKNPFHLWAQHVPNMKCYSTKKKSISSFAPGGCSSAGRAGRLMIERSLVQIPAQGKAELHVEVSLSKILNPTLLISEGPAMSWRLVQGVPCPCPETRRDGIAPAATPRDHMERDKRLRTMTWHDSVCSSPAYSSYSCSSAKECPLN